MKDQFLAKLTSTTEIHSCSLYSFLIPFETQVRTYFTGIDIEVVKEDLYLVDLDIFVHKNSKVINGGALEISKNKFINVTKMTDRHFNRLLKMYHQAYGIYDD